MFENLNNQYPSKNRFDEGKYIDTGEINPLTGERIFYNPKDKSIKTQDKIFVPKKIEKQKTVCKYCGQDPCARFCNYR
jgi:hypothetical protein